VRGTEYRGNSGSRRAPSARLARACLVSRPWGYGVPPARVHKSHVRWIADGNGSMQRVVPPSNIPWPRLDSQFHEHASQEHGSSLTLSKQLNVDIRLVS